MGAVVHPGEQTLRSYGLGELDPALAESVSKHLESCVDCRGVVAGLTSDDFLNRLREARPSPSPAKASPSLVGGSSAESAPDSATAPPAAGSVPPGLAERPEYEIIRELGKGGMGWVFLAHNRIMGRDEVLKVISHDILELPGAPDRFAREIRAVARVQHPNIVTAYSAFRSGGGLVFAMEYVEGLDLARIVTAKGPMPVPNACSYVEQVALGLQHAHEAGLVHRDIKPGNIMLTREGDRALVKVLDFGLAKAGREQGMLDLRAAAAVRGQEGNRALTLAGQMLGTPEYIAPEQIADAQSADIRADIYSLGCTLYHLLSGNPPFQATTLWDVLQAHHTTDARPLNLLRADVPAELAAVLAKMMAKDPHRRFQAPLEVAQAMAPFFRKPKAARATTSDPVTPFAAAPKPAPPVTGPAPPADVPGPAPRRVESVIANLIETGGLDEDNRHTSSAARIPAAKQSRRLLVGIASAAALAAVLLDAGLFFLGPRRETAGDAAGSGVTSATSKPEAPPVIGGPTDEGTAGDRKQAAVPPPNSATKAAPADGGNGETQTLPEVAARTPSEAPAATVSGEAARPLAPPLEARKTPEPAPTRKTAIPGGEYGSAADLAPQRRLSAFGEDVERAIQKGVQFLESQQQRDGSWADIESDAKTGTTSLVSLALLAAGVKPDAPPIHKALEFLRGFGPMNLQSTYATALQTMVFAAAEPQRDKARITANARWLERAQIKSADGLPWPGSWTYSGTEPVRPGDNSNTQYALLGLQAASEAGVSIDPTVWESARAYWETSQRHDGSWAYTPNSSNSTASMTCAGVASLLLARQGSWRAPSQEPPKKQSRHRLQEVQSLVAPRAGTRVSSR